MSALDALLVLLACGGPPVVLLAFVCSRGVCGKDLVKLVAVAFAAGIVAAAGAFFVFEGLAAFPAYRPLVEGQVPGGDDMTLFLLAVVGPVEECAKLAAVTIAFRSRRLGPHEPVVMMAAAALGFAAAENWYAMYAVGGPDAGRAAIVPFMHLLFSSFTGWGLARSAAAGGRPGPVYLGLALASAYHGVFNVLEFRGGWWHFGTMPIVVLLWYFLTRNLNPEDQGQRGRSPRSRVA